MGIEEYGVKPPAKPGEKKEKEVTVKDIFADKKQSGLFGEYIRTAKTVPGEDPKLVQERAERLFSGESTSDDMKLFAKQKEQFLARQQEVAEISKN